MEQSKKNIIKYLIVIVVCIIVLILPPLLSSRRKAKTPSTSPMSEPARISTIDDTTPSVSPPNSTSDGKESAPSTSTLPALPITTHFYNRPVDPDDVRTATVVRVNSANRLVLRIGDESTGRRFEVRIIGLRETSDNTDEGKWIKRQLNYYLLQQEIRYVEGAPVGEELSLPVYIYLAGDDFYNEWMLRLGYAYFESDGVNVRHDDLFLDASTDAKTEQRGLYDPGWSIHHPG
mgnify:CR=1 FL=1|jgi:hypothetical protein